MSDPIIICRDVHKWFGQFHALRGINMEVDKGEVIVIFGPSGSGKSTFIRSINRLEEHQQGTIIVDGIELTHDVRNIAAIRSEIGMVFQQFNLFPHLVNGVSLGLLFALIALGFMLIVGVMELINLAHGSLFALGAYLAMVIISPDPAFFGPIGHWYVSLPLGARYIVALVFAPCLVFVVGMGLEVCMRRTYGKDPLYGLLLTFGAAMVIEELIRVIWGSGEQVLRTPELINGAFLFADLIYSKYRFFAAGFAIFIIILVWLFLEKTPYIF